MRLMQCYMDANGSRTGIPTSIFKRREASDEARPFLCIYCAHTADMRGEIITLDKGCKRSLNCKRWKGIELHAQIGERLNQVLRYHGISEPQTQEHCLAHGADMDHPP